jgi:DNA-binding NtrC family response regulator
MSQARVLIVENDPNLLQALTEALRLRMADIIVNIARSATAALDEIVANEYDAIIIDIKISGTDDLPLLSEIQTRRPNMPTIMITGPGEKPLAIHALRGKAFDFIEKPVDSDCLIASLRRAIEISDLRRQTDELERTPELCERSGSIEGSLGLMGFDRQVQDIIRQIRQVAGSPLTILVEGESGTGKDLIARAIHQLSARCKKPFVAIDCGAIPDTLMESELFGYEKGAFTGADHRKEGRFLLAEGGSLFLDEISNLSVATQAKLLRVLQERQVQPLGSQRPIRVNVRIIAASNVFLQQEVQAGRFRLDLYHRLREFAITMPRLRERDDILDLANAFLAEANMEFGRSVREISQAAAEVLLRYHWPGNVRELRNVIRRGVLLASDVVQPEHLSLFDSEDSLSYEFHAKATCAGLSLKQIAEAAAADAELQAIRQALQATAGNKSQAARYLRTDYKTLYLKMKHYGLNAAQFRTPGTPRQHKTTTAEPN